MRNSKTRIRVITGVAALAIPTPAFAHWGHVGELAGHGHWIAIGAAAAAAALAAWLHNREDTQDEDEWQDADEDPADEAAGEGEPA